MFVPNLKFDVDGFFILFWLMPLLSTSATKQGVGKQDTAKSIARRQNSKGGRVQLDAGNFLHGRGQRQHERSDSLDAEQRGLSWIVQFVGPADLPADQDSGYRGCSAPLHHDLRVRHTIISPLPFLSFTMRT
jgi:hypothetical protein